MHDQAHEPHSPTVTALDAGFEPAASEPTQATDGGDDWLIRQLDRVLRAQRPAATAMARRMRNQNPSATPEQLVVAAERWYRRAAMGTGAGVGAAAVIPGVGTATGVALAGAEIVSFLELTALYALTVAELSGVAADDPTRARTLVMAIMLGERGRALVLEFARNRTPGALMKSPFWGELVTQAMPTMFVGELGQRVRGAFLRRFANKQMTGALGKVIPFGIGAAVGAFGNRTLANEVIHTARGAFGPAPTQFRGALSDAALAEHDRDRSAAALERRRPLRALLPGKRDAKR